MNEATRCTTCEKDLATCDTIWAAGCGMFCSRKCGLHYFKQIFDDKAKQHFEEAAEEIIPEEIGLRSYENE